MLDRKNKVKSNRGKNKHFQCGFSLAAHKMAELALLSMTGDIFENKGAIESVASKLANENILLESI